MGECSLYTAESEKDKRRGSPVEGESFNQRMKLCYLKFSRNVEYRTTLAQTWRFDVLRAS